MEVEALLTDGGKLGSKKPRRRMKAAYTKIREQMEFYFSDANLHKDRFLKKCIEASSDGYIALEVFLKFNKIKQLTDDVNVIAEAIEKKSNMLQVNPERTCIRRVTPIREPVNVDERTVYVEYLPNNVDHEWVKRLFSSCGKVVYVSLPRFPTTGDPKGFGFVEFETVEGAKAACKELNNPPANHQVGMFPKSSHQLDALKKKLPEDQFRETEVKAKEIVSSNLREETDGRNESKEFSVTKIPQDKASTDTVKTPKSKRQRTKSENDIGNSSDSSPAKRKKSEVSFELPPEEQKSSEEKVTPGSKKRSRKRKNKTKSAESEDSKGESDPDRTDIVPEKKQKMSSTEIETKAEAGGGESEPTAQAADTGKQQNKENSGKRKRFRRKKDKKEKECPELRVLPKKEWLLLREEYLMLQKTSMALLKKTLKEHKCSTSEPGDKQQRKEIKFIADVIVRVSAEQPVARNNLKSALGEGYQIAYIDVKDGQTEGYIRCKDAESAKGICTANVGGYTFSPVTGDAEKQYWDKLAADRETKLNTKHKHKKRGKEKWTDKAQKVSIENTESKHIIFEDD